ncbi:Acg family FMN-binding oxidoreductase [Hamadaea tsunoensis]|uniref:Acg family FMN-binding oxidoreductase n=1 Tax=Hamadaea tsunoensis TaxID=53368 RepID=UPI000403145E|nr:nitroreductase family protein [Hamadaea tsunoensis]
MTTTTAGDPATISPELLPCLTAAIAAPSIHNTQPWRFRVRHNVVDVFADRGRQLAVLDPDGRALAVSVGAAVFNLRAALLAHGHLPVLTLLPDRGEPDLLARVVAGAAVAPPYAARRLAGAIPHRHSNRRPFASSRVPDSVADDLRAAAVAEGTRLLIADDPLGEGILSVVRTAENRRRDDPDYLVELAAWTGAERGRRDGVPPVAYAPRDPDERLPLRDFGLAHPVRHGWPAAGIDQPTVAVLYTDGDDLRAWLHAGQALERVLLTATAEGLQSTLMTQPLEYPELRALFEDSATNRIAQAIIRFGYGREAPASPRRPLAGFLI